MRMKRAVVMLLLLAACDSTDPTRDVVLRNQIVFASDRSGSHQIYVMNADGSEVRRLTFDNVFSIYPQVSPDGRRIAYARLGEIVVMNADGSRPVNLTNSAADDETPAWSPDGSLLAFSSDQDGNDEIYVMNADGTGIIRITNDPAEDGAPSWSPDGTRIAFHSRRDGNFGVYTVNADGSNPVNTNSPGSDQLPTWSHDGTRISFSSTRNGVNEIFVMGSDGSNPTLVAAAAQPASHSSWSPDDSRLVCSGALLGSFEIAVVVLAGGPAINLTQHPADDATPSWSL